MVCLGSTGAVSYTHLDVYKRQGSTSADEALLTGESRAVPKGLGTEVIAGSYNLSAAVQVRIDKIGQTTRYAQIVALMERVSAEKPRLAILADRIARPFLILSLIHIFCTAGVKKLKATRLKCIFTTYEKNSAVI